MLIILVVFAVSGCVQNRLKPDFAISPLEANYHSALIHTKDGFHFGVAMGKAEVNEVYSFEVRGIHRGTVRVSSNNCAFDQSKYYKNSEMVAFNVPMRRERCIFGISVTPQFSERESKFQSWRGVSGVLVLRRPFFSSRFQAVQERTDRSVALDFKTLTDSTLYLVGCGMSLKQEFRDFMQVRVPDSSKPNDCVIEAVIQNDKDTDLFVFYISRFSPEFQKLSIPAILRERHKLIVEAESSVTYMNFQGVASFGHSEVFDFDTGFDKILLLYSSQGRVTYCNIKSSEEIECYN